MKKIILSIVFVVVALSAAFSQDGKFSIGGELALPLGLASNVYSLGIGATGRYEASIQDKLNWMVTAGFVHYIGKSFPDGLGGTISTSATLIPLQGGVKYYTQETDNGFYVSGEIGLFIATGNGSGSEFGFTPGVGYRTGNWDFSGRFNLVSNFNTLAVRVGYVLGGK
jgi:hypothetical protein